MKNLIVYTYKDEERYVNPASISSINIIPNDKIVLNMSFSLTDKKRGVMSVAYYLPTNAFDIILNSKYFKKNFVYIEGEDRKVYINKNRVSYVTLENGNGLKKDKIIICFCNSTCKKQADGTETIVPDFMYVSLAPNTNSQKVFEKFVNELDKDL